MNKIGHITLNLNDLRARFAKIEGERKTIRLTIFDSKKGKSDGFLVQEIGKEARAKYEEETGKKLPICGSFFSSTPKPEAHDEDGGSPW